MSESSKRYLFYNKSKKVYYTDDDAFFNGKSLKLKTIGDEPLNETPLELAQDQLRSLYIELLKSPVYKNMLILSGAGISVEGTTSAANSGDGEIREATNNTDDSTVQEDKETGTQGKDRSGLWESVESELGTALFTALQKHVGYENGDDKNDLEGLLSRIHLYLNIDEDIEIKCSVKENEGKGAKAEETSRKLKQIKKDIEERIIEECTLAIDPSRNYHRQFLNKLLNRNLKLSRVRFFTTNYDTVIEQAAQEANITLIDGFSFTMPRTFSGVNFDYDLVYREKSRINKEESFVPKVMHLYKMHGSLDWIKTGNGKVQICQEEDTRERVLIYPASNKYESSYEQPYFEMMSRFQNYLRQENTLLIVIGFSLYDKHISNVILEAVRQNPNFTLLICNYYPNGEGDEIGKIPIENTYLEPFLKEDNVFIVNEKFSDFAENYPGNHVYSQIGNQAYE